MRRRGVLLLCCLLLSAVYAAPANAQEESVDTPRSAAPRGAFRRGAPKDASPAQKSKWGLAVRAFFVRQLESDLPSGGRWSANRFLSEARVSYRIQPKIPLTLAFGYRYDSYDFENVPGLGDDAWTSVHTPSMGLPIFVPLNERWSILAIGIVRSSFEGGAKFEDGITGGVIAAAFYKVNKKLTIGPGIGITSDLDDDPTFFPVPIIKWTIRPDLVLETGTGIGANLGPGIFLNYTPTGCWRSTIGARFDRVRFRLDDSGRAPGGVAEESAFNIVGGVTYTLRERFEFSLTGGVGFGGTLQVDDAAGNTIFEEDPDPRFFVGFGLGFTF